MVGTALGRYEINEPLGKGGMGEVYRATDSRLRRSVAIKVLTGQDEDDSLQLLREARAASRLSHPNICVVHEVGEDAGRAFIVMELVEGTPLSLLIPADGLPPESVVHYGAQIADALGHAHQRGVVHRDLKSDNVVVTPEGRAKVLDFGLATPLPQADAEAVTRTQGAFPDIAMLAGTLAYMAPELLRGRPATPHSDIWALGVVIYEMASGRLPFGGASAADLTAAILKDEPVALGSGVHAGLVAIARQALAKEPGLRYATAGEVRAALEALTPSTAGRPGAARGFSSPPIAGLPAAAPASPREPSIAAETATGSADPAAAPSIAVLPFANLGADPDNEFFADGMTEEIINALVNVSGLRVIARTSAFAFKGKNIDIRDIARQLGVDTVVEGSVRRAGSRLRITAQLIDAHNGHHVWSERYDRELQDVFAIQDEIAAIIARRLRADPGAARENDRPTQSMEAYEACLRGRFFWAKGSPDDYAKSADYYERAVALDGDFAQAHAGLADTFLYWGLVADPSNLLARAREAIDRAIECDDTLPESHVTLGMIKFFGEWDWEGAIAALQRALALNPNCPSAHQTLGTVMLNLGRIDEGIAHARRGAALDPLSAQTLQTLQFGLHQAGEHETSLQMAQRALEVAPDYVLAHLVMGFSLLELDRPDEADRVFRHILSLSPDETMARAGLAGALAQRDRRAEAFECIRDIEQRAGGGQLACSAAWANALVGERDAAFRWIDCAIAAREPFVASLPSFCWWDPLRADPRFERTLRRLEFPQWSIDVSTQRARAGPRS